MKKQLVLGLLLIGTTANAAGATAVRAIATGSVDTQLDYYHRNVSKVCTSACKKLGTSWNYTGRSIKGTKQIGKNSTDWRQKVKCQCMTTIR